MNDSILFLIIDEIVINRLKPCQFKLNQLLVNICDEFDGYTNTIFFIINNNLIYSNFLVENIFSSVNGQLVPLDGKHQLLDHFDRFDWMVMGVDL